MRSVTKRRRTPLSTVIAAAAVAAIATAITSGSCLFRTETNLCEAFARRCPPGQTCALQQDACIDIGGCGDGVIDRTRGEVCDDGNIIDGDGCSANCKSNETCGNHIIDVAVGESCDDGNTISGDDCDSHCVAELCGDTIVNKEAGEVCDDGNMVSGDGCSANCKSNETCGNGIMDIHEQCDPVNTLTLPPQDRADCDSDCTSPVCGDGHLNRLNPVKSMRPGTSEHLEKCDDGGDSELCNFDCTPAKCGDGYLNAAAHEDCDPGTGRDSDACDSDCTTPECGDAHTNPKFMITEIPSGHKHPEECDDGGDSSTCNGSNNSSRIGNCQIPSCGDQYVNQSFTPPGASLPEECDDGGDTQTCNGNNNGNDGPGSCRRPACGDGYLNLMTGEICDMDKDGKSIGCSGSDRCDTQGAPPDLPGCQQCIH